MNEIVSYYKNIEEILDPRWRDEMIEGQYLNIGEYINLEMVRKIDFHRLKQIMSNLTDHDRAVIEIARSQEKTKESHDKPKREIRQLEQELDLLAIKFTELKEEKKELNIEIDFYKRFEYIEKH